MACSSGRPHNPRVRACRRLRRKRTTRFGEIASAGASTLAARDDLPREPESAERYNVTVRGGSPCRKSWSAAAQALGGDAFFCSLPLASYRKRRQACTKKPAHRRAFVQDSIGKLAERTGLEPATSGVTGQHSNQLNYRSVPFRNRSNRPWCAIRSPSMAHRFRRHSRNHQLNYRSVPFRNRSNRPWCAIRSPSMAHRFRSRECPCGTFAGTRETTS